VCRQMLLSKCTQTKEGGSCVWLFLEGAEEGCALAA